MNCLNCSSKWSQNRLDYANRLDHAKKSTTDAVKTASRKEIWRKAEAAGDLIGNKLLFQELQEKISSGTLTNESKNIGLNRRTWKEKYRSPKKKTAKYW